MHCNRKLTDEQVAAIRLGDKSDPYYAALYKVGRQAIRQARLGLNYKTCPVPPRTAHRVAKKRNPRMPKGQLTEEQITAIRLGNKSDGYYATLYNIGRHTIRRARLGIHYKTCKTPPRELNRKRTGRSTCR